MESKQRLLEPQLVQTGRADQFSRKVFCDGMRDGVPIALGYFAVSFSLGIAAELIRPSRLDELRLQKPLLRFHS